MKGEGNAHLVTAEIRELLLAECFPPPPDSLAGNGRNPEPKADAERWLMLLSAALTGPVIARCSSWQLHDRQAVERAISEVLDIQGAIHAHLRGRTEPVLRDQIA